MRVRSFGAIRIDDTSIRYFIRLIVFADLRLSTRLIASNKDCGESLASTVASGLNSRRPSVARLCR